MLTGGSLLITVPNPPEASKFSRCFGLAKIVTLQVEAFLSFFAYFYEG